MFNHAVGVFVIPFVTVFSLHVGAKMHASCIPPAEEWLSGFVLFFDEVLCHGQRLFVDCLHAFLCERTGVFNRLSALAIGFGVNYTAWSEDFAERLAVRQHHVARIVFLLWFFLRVEVVQVAEELIETMHGRQMLIAVALMILTELACRVAEAFQNSRHRHVGLLPAFFGSRHTDFRHAAPHWNAAADECRATCCAALLSIIVGETNAFASDSIDVWRLVAHHATVVVADVPRADIVAPNDEDIWLLLLCFSGE